MNTLLLILAVLSFSSGSEPAMASGAAAAGEPAAEPPSAMAVERQASWPSEGDKRAERAPSVGRSDRAAPSRPDLAAGAERAAFTSKPAAAGATRASRPMGAASTPRRNEDLPRMFQAGFRRRVTASEEHDVMRPGGWTAYASPAGRLRTVLGEGWTELDGSPIHQPDDDSPVSFQHVQYHDGDELVDVVVTDGRVSPFVVGRTECAESLSWAGGRSIGLTAGLQVGVTAAWAARFQLSQDYLNSVGDEVREPRVSLAIRRRF